MALEVKAEGLQRKLYWRDVILGTERSILLLCECGGYPAAWHGARRRLGALLAVTQPGGTCVESQSSLYVKGRNYWTVGGRVHVKTYPILTWKRGNWAIAADFIHSVFGPVSCCPGHFFSLLLWQQPRHQGRNPSAYKATQEAQSKWPQGLRGAGKMYPTKTCSLLIKSFREMGEKMGFGARIIWAYILH